MPYTSNETTPLPSGPRKTWSESPAQLTQVRKLARMGGSAWRCSTP